MLVVNVHEAKTHFSALLARVAAGEEIIIGKAGKPVARLVPYRDERQPRQPGGWETVWISDDFDDELPEDVIDEFYKSAENFKW